MLILGVKRPTESRKDGVWIRLPDGRRFKVLVMDDRREQIKLGFLNTPKDVLLYRLNLCDDQGNLKGERP